jgi:retinol dehydrogenase-12
LTWSGFELAFGVDHLGHFLLTQHLLDHIKRTASARVVTVASQAHYRARGIDWDALRKPTKFAGLAEYSVSKLANVLFSAELARRLAGSGVTTYALHPGVVASDVWRSVPWPLRSLIKLAMISTEEGVATTLYRATSREVVQESRPHYDKCRPKQAKLRRTGRLPLNCGSPARNGRDQSYDSRPFDARWERRMPTLNTGQGRPLGRL